MLSPKRSFGARRKAGERERPEKLKTELILSKVYICQVRIGSDEMLDVGMEIDLAE